MCCWWGRLDLASLSDFVRQYVLTHIDKDHQQLDIDLASRRERQLELFWLSRNVSGVDVGALATWEILSFMKSQPELLFDAHNQRDERLYLLHAQNTSIRSQETTPSLLESFKTFYFQTRRSLGLLSPRNNPRGLIHRISTILSR